MMLNRTIKPAPDKEILFRLPVPEKFTLDNGLPVIFVKKTHLPILRINLILNTGSRLDPENKKGMINLFSMMLDEGAGEYNALELNEEFDILGTNFDIISNNDNIFISLRTLKENTDRSLSLFSKVLTRSHFNEASFSREKRKTLIRLLQLHDDPEETANLVFEYNIFGKENAYAYPVIGFPKDVENVTNNDLKDFYSQFFTPSYAAMIVVGDTEKDEVQQKLNFYLKGWNPSGNSMPSKGIITHNEKRILLVHKKNSVQSEIRIGHLSGKRHSPDFFNKTVLNTILGGQFTSRINLNLREDKGYTYGAFSRFNYYKDAAYFFISTSVNAENTGNAVREILHELNKIKEGVTKEELAFARSSLIRKFPANFETNRQIAANIATMVIHSLPDNYFDVYMDKIRHISIEDVNKAALDNIFPDDMAIVIVGDKNKIGTQLKEFGREVIETEIPG